MSYSPEFRENLADGLLKDLNIDNLVREITEFRSRAKEWEPVIVVDEKAIDGKGVEFKLTVIRDGQPQGISMVMRNEEITHLWDGNILVEAVADELVLLYQAKLREILRPKLKNVVSNIKSSGKSSLS